MANARMFARFYTREGEVNGRRFAPGWYTFEEHKFAATMKFVDADEAGGRKVLLDAGFVFNPVNALYGVQQQQDQTDVGKE